jgi:hypothetical protein
MNRNEAIKWMDKDAANRCRHPKMPGGNFCYTMGEDIYISNGVTSFLLADPPEDGWYPCDHNGNVITPEPVPAPVVDWRGERCGTCGWRQGKFCRRVAWMCGRSDDLYAGYLEETNSACPAHERK